MVAQGGDGGTVDIGFAALSGMFERNDDVLVVCYDNEAYMNTGLQRSGATPPGARTMTTQAVGPKPGNPFGQGKNAPRIAMAHGIPYVATATVADVDHAKNIVASSAPRAGHGYAGIDNELFNHPRTGMLFADAKQGITNLIAAVRNFARDLSFEGRSPG